MADAAKAGKTVRTAAEIRRQRLAAELRSNLVKRKQQARGRTAAAESADQNEDEPSGR
jgi:hypothetical protein